MKAFAAISNNTVCVSIGSVSPPTASNARYSQDPIASVDLAFRVGSFSHHCPRHQGHRIFEWVESLSSNHSW